MRDLKITLVQQPLEWMSPQGNRDNFENLLLNAERTDLFILPEMFCTGFTMKPEQVAESMDGPSLEWLALMAKKTGAAITGTLVVSESGLYFNRLIFMQPDGQYHYYDKRHLFRMAREDQYYTAGTKRLVINYREWRICPMICYDLRFPVWSRNRNEFDLLLYVANWPEPRSLHWSALLKARAIENLCYVAGINRVGRDGNQIVYRGDSAIYNAQGQELLQCSDKPGCFNYNLNYLSLSKYRNYFPADRDADQFELHV